MVKQEQLHGVSGWLYFFALTMSVLTPFFVVGSLLSGNDDIFIWFFNLIIMGFMIFVGILIFKKKENAIVWAKGFLVAYLVIFTFETILSFIIPDLYGSDFLSNPVRGIFFALIWIWYLNSSERVKNTFKNTDLGWKKTIIISIGVIVFYALSFAIGYAGGNSVNPTSTAIQNLEPITGELSPGYVVFRQFANLDTTSEIKLQFSSNLPFSVYFVPSETDYNKYMNGQQYNVYQGCSFEDKTFGVINCNVTGGGIILYNPNSQNITYTIK